MIENIDNSKNVLNGVFTDFKNTWSYPYRIYDKVHLNKYEKMCEEYDTDIKRQDKIDHRKTILSEIKKDKH